ncbi:MAG: flagellar FliJ family protein, partial [Lachnospiraceae bacterium]|nr:flagellar FliJ family protein [Lachnospiraceae bacterium]
RANTTAQQTIKEYIQNQILEVEKATAKVEEEREKLRLAQQERKTQEKLKEKAFEAFLQEEKRAEGKEVDELVSYVYGQKQ